MAKESHGKQIKVQRGIVFYRGVPVTDEDFAAHNVPPAVIADLRNTGTAPDRGPGSNSLKRAGEAALRRKIGR